MSWKFQESVFVEQIMNVLKWYAEAVLNNIFTWSFDEIFRSRPDAINQIDGFLTVMPVW